MPSGAQVDIGHGSGNMGANGNSPHCDGSFLAVKSAEPHLVEFAHNDGVLQTLEGPVAYQAGDALLTDELGLRWPIVRSKFFDNYVPVGKTIEGEPGTYCKEYRIVLAEKMQEAFTVQLPQKKGQLSGQPGDYLVTDPLGDQFVVNARVFQRCYVQLPPSDCSAMSPQLPTRAIEPSDSQQRWDQTDK
jgi:hypothetical protein